MSVTTKLKRGVDLPMWEWLRPLPIATAGPSTFATGGKPYGRYIYYIPSGAGLAYRYDVYADGWTNITLPQQSQNTCAATCYNEKQGYQGRVISIPSSTSFNACVPRGNRCVGKVIKIISGTGAGQSRIITAVSAPIIHDTLSITGGSTVALVDTNKNYAVNQWRDYGVRVVSNTLTDFRKIIHNISNTLTFADAQFTSVGLQWAYAPLPVTANPSIVDGVETRVQIESYNVTVNSEWTITPDNTSVFVIESGLLWNVNVVAAKFALQSYDILSDSWFQNVSINGGMLNTNIATDVALETFAETGSALVTRPALSATATTVKLSGSTFDANIYSNYNMRVTAGTGFGQTRTIMSHTSSNDFTLNRALSTTLDATSVVDIVVDNDKLFMTGSAAASMFEFDAVENIWSDRRIIEAGCPSNICAVWPGFIRPIGITSITRVGAVATVTTTNPHGLKTGDTVTIFGTTDALYNITATITVLTLPTTFTYTVAGTPATPATATNSQTTSQLVDPCKSWVVNEHVGKIVTFTSTAYTATGGLQPNYYHRVIASNTATTLSFVAGTAPIANTTTYMITDVRANGGVVSGLITTGGTSTVTMSALNLQPNIYAGLKAVIMDGANWAEVSVTTNAATTVSFTPAIGFTPASNASTITILGVPSTGGGVGLNFLYNTNQLQRGRYMFGLRGAATNYMYLYDCTSNTWDVLNQTPNAETFAGGTSIAYDGNDRIYIQRDATGRVFYYDVTDNNLYSYNTLPYAQGSAVIGNKMSIVATEDNVKFLYTPRHGATEFWRSLLWI